MTEEDSVDQQTVAVNVVELGSSIEHVGDGAIAPAARKLPSQSLSSSRPRPRRRHTDRMTQRQQQSQHQQHPQPTRKRGGGAPWSGVKTAVRRRSREMYRRLSSQGRNGNDSELQRLRETHKGRNGDGRKPERRRTSNSMGCAVKDGTGVDDIESGVQRDDGTILSNSPTQATRQKQDQKPNSGRPHRSTKREDITGTPETATTNRSAGMNNRRASLDSSLLQMKRKKDDRSISPDSSLGAYLSELCRDTKRKGRSNSWDNSNSFRKSDSTEGGEDDDIQRSRSRSLNERRRRSLSRDVSNKPDENKLEEGMRESISISDDLQPLQNGDKRKKHTGDIPHGNKKEMNGLEKRKSEITVAGYKKNDYDAKKIQSASQGDQNHHRGSSGFRVTPFIVCTICVCYCLSILLVGGLGFWLHMNLFAYKDDGSIASPNGDNNERSGQMTNNSDMNEPGRPSHNNSQSTTNSDGNESVGQKNNNSEPVRPSHNNSQSTTNSDGSVATKGSPSTLFPSFTPSIPLNTAPSTSPSTSPSTMPSTMPSTSSFPTSFPSSGPTTSPSFSMQPSVAPSTLPSSSPTTTPGCPDKLTNSATLGSDNLLTLKYEVVIYQGNMTDLGGLLCISLEYSGDAGWIGLAFSDATRDPQFGRKEAIIGIVGLQTTSAMSMDGSTSLGQQNVVLESGPNFVNPGKYKIPAGGIGNDAYYGPSLKLLSDIDEQTLIDGSVGIIDQYAGIISDQSKMDTVLSFAKYLREPDEIEIDPYDSTLLLYAVAPLDGEGNYDGNPEWKSTYLNFLENSAEAKSGLDRKRKRQHSEMKAFNT